METTAEVPDPFGPMLCFDLYAASRALTAAYRPLLKPLGLTYPQYLVLVTLWPNRERTIGEVGEQLCLDYGTLTPLIRRMETNGLLQRAPAGDDERLVVLRLSARGRRLSREQPAIQRAIQERIGLDQADVAALQTALRHLWAPKTTSHQAHV